MSAIELVKTADGSYTLFVPDLGEHYHSVNGALQESNHVFIKHGLLHFIESNPGVNKIGIFEMGFGTGLNALLALKISTELHLEIEYTSVEKFPIPPALATKLDYGNLFDNELFSDYFLQFHQSPWGVEKKFDQFTLLKIQTDLAEYVPTKNCNIVFFDAFAPDVQPQLWTLSIFSKIFSFVESGGVLTTYSAKGDVRRNLIAAGFAMEKLQGPPGKRHMLRGIKN